MIGRERWRFGTHPSRQAAKACPVGGARTWPGLAGLLAAILAGTIDFVPAAGLAVGSALLATLPAWWIYGQPSRRTSLRGSRKTIDRACMVFLFAGTWATLAILVPCLPTVLGGPLTVERHDVLSRQAPWRGGLCHALRIEDFGWPAPRAICVSKVVWQASEPGQTMAVRVSRSPWGIFIHELEPVCGGLVEALPVSRPIDVSQPVRLERNLRITDSQTHRLVFRFARAALPFGELRKIIGANGLCDAGVPLLLRVAGSRQLVAARCRKRRPGRRRKCHHPRCHPLVDQHGRATHRPVFSPPGQLRVDAGNPGAGAGLGRPPNGNRHLSTR